MTDLTPSTNGHAPDDRTRLREARRRNALLREEIAGKRLARAKQLAESTSYWVEPYMAMLSRFQDRDVTARGFSSRYDRAHGRAYPFYTNETELALLRAPARVLCGTNAYAAGFIEGVSSYVISTGFTYAAACDDPADAPLQAAAQRVLDQFAKANQWHGGEQPGIEDETFWRSIEDGEFFLNHFPNDDGTTAVRVAEPEQVTQPPGESYEEYSFGVRTDPLDTQRPLAYWITYTQSPGDGREYDPRRITHYRRNVKRSMKRGITDFAFDTLDAFRTASKLMTNLGEAGAEQAAIVGIRQHVGATQDQVAGFVDDQADWQQWDYFQQRYGPQQQYGQGRWEDVGENTQYVAPPAATNGSVHLAIHEGLLRMPAVRWCAPEWIATASMAAQNYANSLTAESKFVRRVLRAQRDLRNCYARSYEIALENWCNHHGGLRVNGVMVPTEQVLARVRVVATSPSPETRDKASEAQRFSLELQAGVRSVPSWQKEIGLDPKEMQREIDEWKDKNPDPMAAAMGGAGPGGGPAGAGDENGDGLDDDPFAIDMGGDDGDPSPAAESLLESALREAGFTGDITDKAGRKRHYVDGKQVARDGTAATGTDPLDKDKDGAVEPAEVKGLAKVKASIQSRVDAITAAVPEKVKAPLANAYHALHETLMAGNNAAKALAVEAGRQRGMTEEQTARLARCLSVADLVAPAALGLGVAAAAGPVAGKLAAYTPVASMGYLAYSTARDPKATLTAAAKLLAERFPDKVRGAWQFAVGAVAHPLTRQGHAESVMESADDIAGELADRLASAGDRADEYEAAFAVALDETGDPAEAMAMADAATGRDAAESVLAEDGFTGKKTDSLGREIYFRAGVRVAGPHANEPGPDPLDRDRDGSVSADEAGAKAKFVGQTVPAVVLGELAAADRVSNAIAESLGGVVEEQADAKGQADKKPFDVRVKKKGGGFHDIEVKSLLKGSKQSISVHEDALLRKVNHIKENPANTFHTVVRDLRDSFGGGEFAENYSGHGLYYKRGNGRYSLGSMYKVKDERELRKLLDTPDDQLPEAARGSLPPPPPPEKLAEAAEKAHAARYARDKARKERNRDKLRQQARDRAAAKKAVG